MNQERLRGGIKNAVGQIQETAEELLGNTGDRVKGAGNRLRGGLRQAGGRANDVYGDALERIEDNVLERPLPALAVALAVGLFIGLLAARRY